MVLWFVLIMCGVQLLSSGRAAILGYTIPIFTAVIGFIFFATGLRRDCGWVSPRPQPGLRCSSGAK